MIGCIVDYFDYGYYIELYDKFVILFFFSFLLDICSGMCMLDILCSGFSFNKFIVEC